MLSNANAIVMMTNFEKAGGGEERDQKRFLELPWAKARQLKILIIDRHLVANSCIKLKLCFLHFIARQIQWKFHDVITPSEWWTDIKPHLTLENVFKLGKFLLVLFMAAITGTGHFIIHIASHTNRFVHGLSGLIRSLTPFLLACVDAVNRCIAGVFTLIGKTIL